MLYINCIRCIFIHSFNHFFYKIHTHPHMQVTSFLSTVAEHNVRISVVEDSPLRWVKEHSLHLLHPPDPQPWLSHFVGKLALCCTQIKHPGEGGEKEGRVYVYVAVGGCFMRKATSEERRRWDKKRGNEARTKWEWMRERKRRTYSQGKREKENESSEKEENISY